MMTLLKLSIGVILAGTFLPVIADDTEIYINQNTAVGKRPKVLIIFDNSGSMSTAVTKTESRIQIARRVVKSVIDANPGVDYGLTIFNDNISGETNPHHGGRIVRHITENQSATDHSQLKTTVEGLTAKSFTPLCETLSEAYRYYAGLNVNYGDDDPTATPGQDSKASSNGKYNTPLTDCEQAYIILMTDGEPTRDTDADDFIDKLPGIGTTSGNRLDELAGWLYTHDIDNNDKNGIQRIVTYTIGFQIDHALLKSTAEKGGGNYFTANNADQLTDAFQSAISQILQTTASFTSPSLAVNSFNRARSLNDVYMAMFRPESGPRWLGNIKKLTIDKTGTIVDANGKPAIDPVTQDISSSAVTIWNSVKDGNIVNSGGVGDLLVARNPSTRVIKTDTGSNGALENYSSANTNLTSALLGAASDAERAAIINWARGVDIDDEDNDKSTTDTRPWIMGDPLHSQPLVINYGARGSYTETKPDTRIVVGTNAGFLHMFSGDDGGEGWAFTPKMFASLHKTLRANKASEKHPYAIDGSPVVYIHDDKNDGTISGTDDKVYLFFGLQRGGQAYFAMDISDPDNPKSMWTIDNTTSGFTELGQTWSTPTVGHISGISGPVLIFGAGFDPNKDATTIGTKDTKGRGVFIVDVTTGNLIWSATPNANSTKNLQVATMEDSSPGKVSTVDSNGDKLIDRLYVTDTGGNIWRVDLPGQTLPTSAQDKWSMFKFATVGGETAATDRRFYHGVDIIQTRDAGKNFDAILAGTGNRSHPNQTATTDRFYMFKDFEINSSFHGSSGTKVPDALKESDLYDATADLPQIGTTDEQVKATASLASSPGWFITLEQTGEKSLSNSVTLGGIVFFTTFIPSTQVTLCEPAGGTAFLYAVRLHSASSVFHFDTALNTNLSKNDRKLLLGSRLPSSVAPHFGDDGIRIVGVGEGGSMKTGVIPKTTGTYWYREAN